MAKKQFPETEEMLPQKNYSFSINLAELHSKRYGVQYDTPMIALYNRYNTIFEYLMKTVKLNVYPELSRTGKLHYHGYIKFPNRFTILPTFVFLSGVDASIQIDALNETIDTCYEWDIYIKKQRHIMRHYMKQLGLKYRIHN